MKPQHVRPQIPKWLKVRIWFALQVDRISRLFNVGRIAVTAILLVSIVLKAATEKHRGYVLLVDVWAAGTLSWILARWIRRET